MERKLLSKSRFAHCKRGRREQEGAAGWLWGRGVCQRGHRVFYLLQLLLNLILHSFRQKLGKSAHLHYIEHKLLPCTYGSVHGCFRLLPSLVPGGC